MPARQPTGPWLGIPTPPFGLTETAPARPSPWTSPQAGYYYVDGDTGNDSGNANGDPTAPRKTIPRALAAGSYVEVHGTDTFAYSSPNQIVSSGTVGSPVFIRAQTAGTAPTFTGELVIRGSYTIVELVQFDTTGGGCTLSVGDHLVLRHFAVLGTVNTHANGVSIADDLGAVGTIQYHVVWNGLIHDTGDWLSVTDDDCHGVAIGGWNIDHIWILGLECYHCSGDSLQINASQDAHVADLHHVYMAGCYSHNNRQSGGWCKQATDVVFSQNIVADNHANGAFGSFGIGLGGQYAPNRVWFLFNEIYDCDYGIQLASDNSGHGVNDAIYYLGNVIHDLSDADSTYGASDPFSDAAISCWGSKYHVLINNTIYNVGVHGVCFPTVDRFPFLYGNIIDTIAVDGRHEYFDQATTSSNRVGDGNVYAPNFRYFAAHLGTPAGQIDPPVDGANQIATSAGFLNAGGANFRLSASSVAIDAETSSYTSIYDTYYSVHGVDIRKDASGQTRPAGVSWDAGAYEYRAGYPVTRVTS